MQFCDCAKQLVCAGIRKSTGCENFVWYRRRTSPRLKALGEIRFLCEVRRLSETKCSCMLCRTQLCQSAAEKKYVRIPHKNLLFPSNWLVLSLPDELPSWADEQDSPPDHQSANVLLCCLVLDSDQWLMKGIFRLGASEVCCCDAMMTDWLHNISLRRHSSCIGSKLKDSEIAGIK